MKNLLLLLFCCASICAAAQSGITWGMTGMNIAGSSYDNMHPRMALDGAGNPLVIWSRMSDESVFLSRWTGTAFTTPEKINPTGLTIAGASWMGPDIASKGDTVYVVVRQTPESMDTSKHIYIFTSFNGGVSFSAPVQVDNVGDSVHRFPTVTVDDSGNPIVAFMKFNSSFLDSRWVVTKSTDYGNTFSTDVKASGWGGSPEVCDCCPGAIVSSGNKTAMLYRDNNSNMRDIWTGISADNAATFASGFEVDNNNWMIMSCPSTGPDGVIIGDTLYSTFASAGGGTYRTYLSKSSISSGAANSVSTLATGIVGLGQQNYPRIASSGNAMAIVWKQGVSGVAQLPIMFTNDIANGFPTTYDTVDLGDITNADVAISNGNIFVVWQDDNAGTVKYRFGTYTPAPLFGAIQVTITPPAAVAAGVTWNVDGNSAQVSGTTIGNLPVGTHTINFTAVNGWLAPATQFVTVTANNTLAITGTFTPATGLNEIAASNFSVYPNPANDYLNITSTANVPFALAIFNPTGEKIYSSETATNCKLAIANWPGGIYFIQLKSDDKFFTQKFIKQ